MLYLGPANHLFALIAKGLNNSVSSALSLILDTSEQALSKWGAQVLLQAV